MGRSTKNARALNHAGYIFPAGTPPSLFINNTRLLCYIDIKASLFLRGHHHHHHQVYTTLASPSNPPVSPQSSSNSVLSRIEQHSLPHSHPFLGLPANRSARSQHHTRHFAAISLRIHSHKVPPIYISTKPFIKCVLPCTENPIHQAVHSIFKLTMSLTPRNASTV